MNLAQLQRIRWAVRGTLALGVTVSTAANILHANPNPISQAIAAWPPLALLLTVELISRVPVHRRWLAVARLFATGAIAGIAAWVSYWHMAGVASRYGETGAAPYLIPFSVDGLVIVASVSLVELASRIADASAEARTFHLPAPAPAPVVVEAPAEAPATPTEVVDASTKPRARVEAAESRPRARAKRPAPAKRGGPSAAERSVAALVEAMRGGRDLPTPADLDRLAGTNDYARKHYGTWIDRAAAVVAADESADLDAEAVTDGQS